MFKKIRLLALSVMGLISLDCGWSYLFFIKSLTGTSPDVEGIEPIEEHKSLYKITEKKAFNVSVDGLVLKVETKQFCSEYTPSTFLYPEVTVSEKKNSNEYWKLVSDGQSFYTLILADSREDLDAEEEEEQNQAQKDGNMVERIIVQSSDQSE